MHAYLHAIKISLGRRIYIHHDGTILSIISGYEHKRIIAYNAQRTEHNIEFEVVKVTGYRRACIRVRVLSASPIKVAVLIF